MSHAPTQTSKNKNSSKGALITCGSSSRVVVMREAYQEGTEVRKSGGAYASDQPSLILFSVFSCQWPLLNGVNPAIIYLAQCSLFRPPVRSSTAINLPSRN